MPGGYPCECCGCEYFADDFDRANGTNLGADWTEAVGDWSIASNKLSIASSNAVCTCDETNPDGTAITATATLQGAAEGDQLRILVDYVDSNNYWFGEVEWGPAGGSGAMRLWQRSAGSNTLKGRTAISTAVVGTSVTMAVCIGNGTISAKIGTDILATTATESTSAMGLATGTVAGAVTFDDVELSKHSEDDASCPACEDTPCRYFFDDFGRSDGTDVGGDWTEAAGAWTLDTEWLKVSATSAVCVADTGNPDGDDAIIVTVTALSDTAGDKLRLIANYVDSNNYWFLEIEWGTAVANGTARLYKRIAGVETQVGSNYSAPSSPDVSMDLRLCVTSYQIATAVWLTGTEVWQPVAVGNIEATSMQTGVGTGGTLAGDAKFTDPTVTRHYQNNTSCMQCPRPCDACEDGQGPLSFEVVVSDVTSDNNCLAAPQPAPDCSGWNDTFISEHEVSATGSYCEWVYEFPDYEICSTGEWVNPRVLVRLQDWSLFDGTWWVEVCLQATLAATATRYNLVYFRKVLNAAVDCLNLDELDIPFVDHGGLDFPPCDGSAATCKVSTVT